MLQLSGPRNVFRVPNEQVRSASVRNPVRHAVDGVVWLILQPLEDGFVVRDEVVVNRCDVTAQRSRRSVASPEADTPS